MSRVLRFDPSVRDFVRFFEDYVVCHWCDSETRGRCYEETQAVVCSQCGQPLFVVDDEETAFEIIFDSEMDDPDGRA
jgi:translation initiation factor 2 beta subunit (eIF-2beta)/eIF-5